ncbi:MAG: hypothetical protein JG764_2061 [Clostridiales bacterium]|jgi:3-hydroxyisobutyrate dehydrogenase|nr:hypothetical protein [Clostridiales bacterium]
MKIGFIGLGNMGKPMAERLVRAGYDLTVYVRNPDTVRYFKNLQVPTAVSLKDIGSSCNIIITMLPNSEIVEEVIIGEQGIFNKLQEGTILIDMSTADPSSTRKIASIVKEKNAHMLDAPVSGGVKGAMAGNLTIMVGGEIEIFQQVKSILNVMGKNVLHVGPVGSGHTIKVLNNLLSATHFMATTEVMAIGLKAGLNPNKMLEILNTSSGRNYSSEYKFPNFILNRQFNAQFSMDLMCKDLSIALQLANNLKVPSFLSSIVQQFWSFVNEQSGRNCDHTEFVKFYEEALGAKLEEF